MRYLLTLLIVFILIFKVISQDYTQSLYERNGKYRRIASDTPDICFDDTYYWNYILEQAVIELQRAIPVTANQGECHIKVEIVENIRDRYPLAHSDFTGYAPDFFFDPRLVLIERNTSMGLGITIHELLHALGMWKHCDNPEYMCNAIVYRSSLSDFDIELLQFLYSQEALEQSCIFTGC